MKTRAAILFKLNSKLEIEELEIPKLKKGQVLVRILSSGVCRAQANEVAGLKGPDRHLPHLLGHEAAGEVIDVGGGVRKVRKGDYVVVSWIRGKGIDGGAVQYRLGGRPINAGPIATFCQYAVISEQCVVKVPKSIPPAIGAILGCAVPTGMGIIRHTLAVRKDSSVAIFGVGGVGSCALLGAVYSGAKTILAIDISDEKLDFAKKLGATITINVNRIADMVSRVKELTGGGVDYAIEASGSKAAMETAFEIIKDTGKVVIAGNTKKGERICLNPFDMIKGKKIVGSWGGESIPDEDIPYYAKEYLSGHLNLDKLITQKFRLEDVNKALSLMEENRVLGRVVIEF